MKCDIIAQGIINAAKTVKLSVSLVVRLEGTNVERGKQLLKESGVALIAADDLADAAQKAVAAAAIPNPKSQIDEDGSHGSSDTDDESDTRTHRTAKALRAKGIQVLVLFRGRFGS